MAGWLAGWGWVVGETDLNENPVVSLDFDLDFGPQFRVCQKQKGGGMMNNVPRISIIILEVSLFDSYFRQHKYCKMTVFTFQFGGFTNEVEQKFQTGHKTGHIQLHANIL